MTSENAAPAEMPGVEEIARAIYHGKPRNRPWENLPHEFKNQYRKPARAILALFAPILAEKDLHHATGERITRKDLNNAHRKGAEEGRLAAHLIDGVNSPLNACCYRDQCKALEARALAAEAALAAAELVLCDLMNAAGHYKATHSEIDRGALTATIKAAADHFAAVIRAQGE